AKSLQIFLQDETAETLIQSSARSAINLLIGNFEHFINLLKENLDFKIKCYQMLVEQKDAESQIVAWDERYEQFSTELNKKLIPLLTSQTAINSSDHFETFKIWYESEIHKLIYGDPEAKLWGLERLNYIKVGI